MDKYAVDIDEVLDAFEKSEALQAEQPIGMLTNASLESSSFLTYNKPSEELHNKPSEELYCDKDLNSHTANYNSFHNLPSKNIETSVSSGSSNKDWNLSEADFSPTVVTQSNQSATSVNYDIYYKPFHTFSEPLKGTKLSSVSYSFPSTSSTISSEKCFIQSCNKQSDLLNSKNLYNLEEGEEEVLCISVESNNKQEGKEHVNILQGKLDSSSTLSNFIDNNTASNSDEDKYVQLNNDENTVSNAELSLDKTNDCILQKSSPSFSEKCSNTLLTTTSTHLQKVDYKLSTLKSDSINGKFSDSNVLNNAESLSKQTECHSKRTLCFSEIEEPSLTFNDMSEYLSDVISNDQVLDEDSGVSSQEDLNGNNLTIDTYKVNSFQEEKCLSNSNNEQYSKSEILETQSNNNQPSNVTAKEHKSNDMHSLSLKINFNDASEIKSSTSTDLCSKDILNFPENSDEKNASILGAIPKRDNFMNNSECLQSFTNILKECDHVDNFSDVEELNSTEFQSSEDAYNKTSKEFTKNESIHTTCNGSDKVNDKLLLENELVNYYLDTEVVLNSADVLDCSKSKEDLVSTNLENEELFDNTDSSILSENSLNSSKIQRPTTLNLPFCNTATTITNPPVCSGDASSAYENCDVPSEDIFVQTPLGDANDLEDKDSSVSDSHVTNHIPQIGSIKPFWIPDSEAANCMHCNIKFTVIKRRHHCRACGKVLCSSCCNQKARLLYLSNKENRVCQQCFDLLSAAEAEKSTVQQGESPVSSSGGSSPSFSPAQVNSNFAQKGYWRPHPNNPDDYCSTISPLQQVQHLLNRPPPTVMVPVGVLKRGAKPRGEPKQVIFSDGIRPGGDLTDLTESTDAVPAYRRSGRRRVDKSSNDVEATQVNTSLPAIVKKTTHAKHKHKKIVVSDCEGPLPPILLLHDQPEIKLDIKLLIERLKGVQYEPIVFAITKNLHVLTKITKLDCYFGKECWCFTSHGLCTVGQDEVLFILERFPDEDAIPRDAFRLFSKLYDNACKGSTVSELGHIVFPENIFGNWEHRGFLFIRPTFQILNQLVLPNTPFLVAILIQKWEVPWAKVFPLRLMLRLGEECRHYPCSLVSVRCRKPVYYKIGETIMSVLADLRNYQFTIPFVPGLVVHIEEKKTCVNIPRNRYEKLIKVLNSNNVEHVLALGANFSMEADSHLVCMQSESGEYSTQAMNIKNTTRKVTGASFIVFSGALKSSTGFSAKFSIVEDGLLIQIPQETMDSLHSALREMRDLTINCGPINAPDPEVVIIQWTEDDKKFNIGVISPVDGRIMDGIPSLRIHSSTDYVGENYLIRWTEVFFLEVDENANRRLDSIDPCRLAETVAQAFCMALIPFLNSLADADMTRIGLRVILDTERDKVEYDVGAKGQPLPGMYMNALDSSLIPVISRVTGATQDEPIALELVFHILIK